MIEYFWYLCSFLFLLPRHKHLSKFCYLSLSFLFIILLLIYLSSNTTWLFCLCLVLYKWNHMVGLFCNLLNIIYLCLAVMMCRAIAHSFSLIISVSFYEYSLYYWYTLEFQFDVIDSTASTYLLVDLYTHFLVYPWVLNFWMVGYARIQLYLMMLE
jgi:hypothetical protein